MRRSFWLVVTFVAGLAAGILVEQGLTRRYAAPRMLADLAPLRQLEDGIMDRTSGASGSLTQGMFEAERTLSATLQRQPGEAWRRALVRHVREVFLAAQRHDLGVIPGGFVCMAFGDPLEDPLPAVTVTSKITTDHSTSSSTVGLNGDRSHVIAQLHLAARRNLAVQTVWTFLLDVRTGACHLHTRYGTVGAGYQEIGDSQLGDLTLECDESE